MRAYSVREDRRPYNRPKLNRKITSADNVYDELIEYASKEREHFIVISLDGTSRIIEKRVVSIGTINQSLVHPREVFRDAISDNAVGIIVAHNHPSGQLEPSLEDKKVTKRLKEAGKLLGINLLDHVILAENGFYSFQTEDIL